MQVVKGNNRKKIGDKKSVLLSHSKEQGLSKLLIQI